MSRLNAIFLSLTWMPSAHTFRRDQKAVRNVSFTPCLVRRHFRVLRIEYTLANFGEKNAQEEDFLPFIDNEVEPSYTRTYVSFTLTVPSGKIYSYIHFIHVLYMICN